MRIIIDADFLLNRYLPGSHRYAGSIILGMAERQPQDEFIYMVRAPLELGPVPGNVSIYQLKSSFPGRFGSWWRHAFQLPGALKKLQADLFIAVGHANVNTGRVPGCLLLPDGLLQPYASTKKKRPRSRYRRSGLRSAAALITMSAHDAQGIARQFAVAPEKIHVLPPDAGLPVPALSDEEREAVKEQYAGGLEYFLFAGDIGEQHSLLELLKAFSQFKKWQQSNMQLVITGTPTAGTGELLQKMATFRYRNHVHILPGLPAETEARLVAAAYAFVYPSPEGHFAPGIVPAMLSGVPVITSEAPPIRELAGRTVLYASPGNDRGFTAAMQLVFKDEALRSQVAGSAKERIGQTGSNDLPGACHEIILRSLQSDFIVP